MYHKLDHPCDRASPSESSLPSSSRGILPLLEAARLPARPMKLKAGHALARAGTDITEVFVPRDAIVLVARQTALDPVPLTLSMIGYEGLVGWQALLATDRWTHDALIICPGEVAAVQRGDLLAACAVNPALHGVLLRVAHNHTLQLAQSVVANLGHSLERRLARWLLMLDDRTLGDTFHVTHAQLAQILNVRRASITDAVHVLEGETLIFSSRGKFKVRDRAGLQARAGQSYGLSENDYSVSVEPFGKGSRT